MDLQVKGIYRPSSASSRSARAFIACTIAHKYCGMPALLPVSAIAIAAQEWHIF